MLYAINSTQCNVNIAINILMQYKHHNKNDKNVRLDECFMWYDLI